MNDSECQTRSSHLTDSVKRLRPNRHYQDEVKVDHPLFNQTSISKPGDVRL
jgi:hypothetical protein